MLFRSELKSSVCISTLTISPSVKLLFATDDFSSNSFICDFIDLDLSYCELLIEGMNNVELMIPQEIIKLSYHSSLKLLLYHVLLKLLLFLVFFVDLVQIPSSHFLNLYLS